MNLKIGEKIKILRKQKNISQEVLAQYLGVSFQSVSKWENETTMPDITLVPAIASFFGVSTDEFRKYILPSWSFRQNYWMVKKNSGQVMPSWESPLIPQLKWQSFWLLTMKLPVILSKQRPTNP